MGAESAVRMETLTGPDDGPVLGRAATRNPSLVRPTTRRPCTSTKWVPVAMFVAKGARPAGGCTTPLNLDPSTRSGGITSERPAGTTTVRADKSRKSDVE